MDLDKHMDIATDMDALQNNLDNLSDRIQNLFKLIRMSAQSLLIVLYGKRAKLIELRDKHMVFSTQDLIKALDLEIQKLQA